MAAGWSIPPPARISYVATGTGGDARQPHPVRGRAEAHVLLHTPTVPLTGGDREPG